MNHLSTDLSIRLLEESHMPSAVKLFTTSFCYQEPITKYLNITEKDYEPFAVDIISKAVNDGMSKIIIDNTNHVKGIIIAEDMADPFIPRLSAYPKLAPIIQLLEDLSRPFVLKKLFLRGTISHVWIAAIDLNLMGRGFYKQLGQSIVNLMMQKSYQFIYAEFTNAISEKIVHEFPEVKLCNEIEYKQFQFKGEQVFKNLEGKASAYVTPIQPGLSLESIKQCYIDSSG